MTQETDTFQNLLLDFQILHLSYRSRRCTFTYALFMHMLCVISTKSALLSNKSADYSENTNLVRYTALRNV